MVCCVVVYWGVLVCLCVIPLFREVFVRLFVSSWVMLCVVCVFVCVLTVIFVVMYGLMLYDGGCLSVFVFACAA